MPITIVQPTVPEHRIGPGMPIDVSTDFIGPFAPDAQWLIEVTEVGNATEGYVIRQTYPCTTNRLRRFLGEIGLEDPRENRTGYQMIASDTQALVRISLQLTPGVTAESATVQALWDQNTYQVHNLLGIQPTAVSTGPSADLLQAIYDAVYKKFTF